MTREVRAFAEQWPIAGRFTIARGSKTTADVVVATVTEDRLSGFGECLPYPRYGESVAGTLAAISDMADETRLTRARLLEVMPAGAARNALDCALWDLEARQAGQPVWQLAALPTPEPVVTAFTLSLDDPTAMAEAAAKHAHRPLIKLKLGSAIDVDIRRLRAVRRAAPGARLIVDANEGWSLDDLKTFAPVAADLGVALLEQPLPAADDAALAAYQSPVPLGADESLTATTDLTALTDRYTVLNVKLDKTGGLTRAISLVGEASALGFEIMIGCMVATSLSMAPALLLAQTAQFVDLDGPLLLERDREPGLVFGSCTVGFPSGAFWGTGTPAGWTAPADDEETR